MTKVLIAGESELLVKGLESLVRSDPSLAAAGSLDDLSGLAEAVERLSPGVVVVAAGGDTMGVLENFIGSRGAGGARRAALVVLGPVPQGSSVGQMLRSGITALLPQDAGGEEILAAVHAAVAGLVVVHPAMIESDGDRHHPHPMSAPASPLTPRELEVLGMLAEGLGNKEIAWRLKISGHTVKFHITSIFTKLDVSSRAEAVSLGYRSGLILV